MIKHTLHTKQCETSPLDTSPRISPSWLQSPFSSIPLSLPPSGPPVILLFAAWPPLLVMLRGRATAKLTGQSGGNNLKSVILTASYLAYYCISAALLLHASSCITACQQLSYCMLAALLLHVISLLLHVSCIRQTPSEYPSWKGIFYDKQVLAERTHGTLQLLRKAYVRIVTCIYVGGYGRIRTERLRTDTDRKETKNNGWFSPQASNKSKHTFIRPMYTLFYHTSRTSIVFCRCIIVDFYFQHNKKRR